MEASIEPAAGLAAAAGPLAQLVLVGPWEEEEEKQPEAQRRKRKRKQARSP